MRRRTVALVTGSLVLAGTGCAARGVDVGPQSPTPAATATPTTPTSSPTPTASPGAVPPAKRAPSALVAEPPVLIALTGGREVPIRSVGTTAEGVLDVPDDIGRAGWWRGGARLGDPFGSILVAAHVDSSTQGLGPFAELLTVSRGARLRLSSEHLTQTFEVRSRQLVAQGSLVREGWLFDASGEARLTLVTCAPPYDAARGGYQNLAVVTAVPVSGAERA